MTRYADPTRCPDCLEAIDADLASCASCGLLLRGETAGRLFWTLSSADDLLASLRAASVSPAGPVTSEAGVPPMTAGLPAYPRAAARRHRPGLPGLGAASVPKILLTLGAGCLLIAALVFIVVAWSGLGVGGRTAGLVVLTLAAGGLAARFAHHGLRGAAEALSVVGLGLLALDVVGADHAGWFGALSTPVLLDLLGVLLGLTSAAAAIVVRRSAVERLIGAELVAALGVALLTTGVGTYDRLPSPTDLLLATGVAAVCTAALHLVRLRVARDGSASVTVIAWLFLTGYALGRVLDHDASWSRLWGTGNLWPLLMSAALVGAVAVVRRVPVDGRVAAAAVAQSLLLFAALAPAEHFSPTGVTLVGLGILVAAAAATRLLPRPWGRVNLLSQVLAGAGVLWPTLALLDRSADRLAHLVDPVWAGRAGDLLARAPQSARLPSGWLLPLCVLALLMTGWTVARALSSPSHDVTEDLGRGWARSAVAVLAGTVVAGAALYPVPVWLLVVGLLATAAGLTAWWLRDGAQASVTWAAVSTVAGVVLALHAPWLSADAALATVALAGAVHLRASTDRLSGMAGATLACAVAGSVWSLDGGLERHASPSALDALVVLGVLVLLAPYAPRGWWRCPAPVRARTGTELATAAVAVGLAVTGVLMSPPSEGASWTAVYLTLAGVVAVAMSLLRTDRRLMGPVGFVLLAAATWARLYDLGVRAPEPYTLPSATVLIAIGLWHLRRQPDSGTLRSVGAGLGLGLVPSLLWCLADPTGPRVLLLGLACLVLVLLGARLHATAPLVWGATVGSLLVLRLAAPYVGDAVPRWVLIGAAGALLVTLGATWERRLDEARAVGAYVRALR